jgi:nucleoid-associated protein YgaU
MRSLKINRYLYTVLIPLLSIIASCELDVPINEMSLAKMTITRAVEVKADKYAPDELKKAREFLYASHGDLKKDDTKKAKENAVQSLNSANQAVNKSLPLLSGDTLEEAKKLQADADKLYAEKYAPQEFNESTKNLNEAITLHDGKEYWHSYLKSKEVIGFASEAKSKAETHIPELKEKIEQIRNDADSLKASRGADFASEDLNSVSTKLDGAHEDINNLNLKEASAKIDEAANLLNDARSKTQKGIAAEKIKEAENALAIANESKLRELFKDDLEKAFSLIPESKQLYESGSFEESIAKSDEAIAILKSVNTAMSTKVDELKKTAADRIESAENTLKKIEGSDMRESFKEDIAKVTPLIAKSKELYEQESYQESIAASDEAHKILNSMNIALEKTAEGARLSKKEMPGAGEYIVKLNLKKRDCLWRIAFYVYKNARLWPLIYSANKEKIKDPDLIFPGQRFVIPPVPKNEEKKNETE